MPSAGLPDWVASPGEDWLELTAAEAGLDPAAFEDVVRGLDVHAASFGGEDHSGGRFGAVLARGGRLVHVWGDREYRHHTASVGKALVWALVGLARSTTSTRTRGRGRRRSTAAPATGGSRRR